jgi:hypothetical protein
MLYLGLDKLHVSRAAGVRVERVVSASWRGRGGGGQQGARLSMPEGP